MSAATTNMTVIEEDVIVQISKRDYERIRFLIEQDEKRREQARLKHIRLDGKRPQARTQAPQMKFIRYEPTTWIVKN